MGIVDTGMGDRTSARAPGVRRALDTGGDEGVRVGSGRVHLTTRNGLEAEASRAVKYGTERSKGRECKEVRSARPARAPNSRRATIPQRVDGTKLHPIAAY